MANNNIFKQSDLINLEEAVVESLKSFQQPIDIKACDHLCYIMKNQEQYTDFINASTKANTLIKQILPNDQYKGKGFAFIKLETPLTFMGFPFTIVEVKLSDNPRFEDGWHHVEFIPQIKLSDIVEQNPTINMEVGRMNDENNQEIGLVITDQYSVKFRTTPILEN